MESYKLAYLQQEEDELRRLAEIENKLNETNSLDILESISESLIDTLCLEASMNKLTLEQIISSLLIIKINRDIVKKYKGKSEKHIETLNKIGEIQKN